MHQWLPHCHTHHTGSQHILLHLYECAQRGPLKPSYASFHAVPVGLESVDWTGEQFNPILGMLALSDNQDLSCLQFYGLVDLECAGRILEVVKAVKRCCVEFLCLIADIINPLDKGLSHANHGLILGIVKQAMSLIDGESMAPLLRPMASGVQRHQQWIVELQEKYPSSTYMFTHTPGKFNGFVAFYKPNTPPA
jgi:hypothetical protein